MARATRAHSSCLAHRSLLPPALGGHGDGRVWKGYMDGAVRSGKRAAAKVIAALRGEPAATGVLVYHSSVAKRPRWSDGKRSGFSVDGVLNASPASRILNSGET